MRYVVDIEAFHGPLDLLLYLIEKDELDIYDIPVAVITEQYLEYLDATGDFELEKLGDFLIMASYLLNLKSRMLLPHFPSDAEMTDEEDNLDPREELIQRLLDYKKYKIAAEHLRLRQDGQCKRIFYRDNDGFTFQGEEKVAGNTRNLFKAYLSVMQSRVKTQNSIKLPQGDINIRDKMEEIIKILLVNKDGLVFQELFTGVISVKEVSALFLALLELIKLQKVQAIQQRLFDDIIIILQVND
jgi:segregation and condensation protein A